MNLYRGVLVFAEHLWRGTLVLCAYGACQAAEPPSAPPRTITNSIGMKLVLIPAGEFMMGSVEPAETLAQAYQDELGPLPKSVGVFAREYPLHRVRITKPFYLGVYEVTVGQFRRFVEDTGYVSDAEKSPGQGVYGWTPWAQEFRSNAKYSWKSVGFEQSDDHPVVSISWNDAVEFCRWLSDKEGAAYRLPTEAEWEYACRAGTTTRHHHGNDVQKLAAAANVADATARANLPWPDWRTTIEVNDGYVFTAPVGKFQPNRFGLFDMHGNVCEWCADWCGEDYYRSSPQDDPEGPASGSLRVLRGGSWDLLPVYARSAYRLRDDPSFRRDNYGFRVARDVGEHPLAADASSRMRGTESQSVPESEPKSVGSGSAAEPEIGGPRPNAAPRKWTDATGQYSVMAMLIDVSGGVVELKKSDGNTIKVALEKLSHADQRYVREQTQVAGRPRRDGLLVETAEGLYYVGLDGNVEPFAEERKVVGRPAVRGSRVFVLVDGAIQEYTPRGKQVKATAISDLRGPPGMVGNALDARFQKYEKSRSRLIALSERGFALVSPGSDWVFFLDDRGTWQRTVKILAPGGNWPDLLGAAAGGGLLISNTDWKEVWRVDLRTFEKDLFMRGDSALGPIAFDSAREICYVCSGRVIHGVSLKGHPRLHNVSQSPKIATVEARPKNRISGGTVRPNFISGIVVDQQFAYLTLLPYGCIVRVNIAAGDSEVFVDGLPQPDVILRLMEQK